MAEPAANLSPPPPPPPEPPSPSLQLAPTPPKRQWSLEIVAGLVGLLTVLVLLVFMLVPVAKGMQPVLAEGANVARPSDLAFLLFAAMAVISAGGVAFSRNIIYSALALLGTLLSTGALYIFLDADYVAVTQLLIYIGGVLVLILFAVMLTSQIGEKRLSNPRAFVLPGIVLLGAMLGLLCFVAARAPWKISDPGASAPASASSVRTIGDVFLREYLLPFEVVSLVLLATLIGAVVIARKELKEP
ncbi:MAG TPA: NADH-quinone oxidoreductase subunit J [Myxococcales bacterium]|nr:NADH-quinone oxidoreductase subunit J [Myxococcales bacterium]